MRYSSLRKLATDSNYALASFLRMGARPFLRLKNARPMTHHVSVMQSADYYNGAWQDIQEHAPSLLPLQLLRIVPIR